MSLQTCWRLAKVWYSGRGDLAWRPRSQAEAEAAFEEVGLSGDLWRFDPHPVALQNTPGELAVLHANLSDLESTARDQVITARIATALIVPFGLVPVLVGFAWYALLPAILWAIYTLSTWYQFEQTSQDIRALEDEILVTKEIAVPPPRLEE